MSPSKANELSREVRGRSASGELKLSQWLAENALVAWSVHPEPWLLEEHMIASHSLPLSLDQNSRHRFHAHLSMLRRQAKARARELPVV